MSRSTLSDKVWFFYILRCRDDSLYSGITTDLEGRLKEHNKGKGAKYTSGRRPVTLVYSERCGTVSEARKREAQVKRWPRKKKEQLIKKLLVDIKMEIPNNKSKFSLKQHKDEFLELVNKTDHKPLAVWAIDCAERVLPYFEEKCPDDNRPRKAIETLQTWINTGVFKMAVIRKDSLDAHAAAREVGEDNAARSAARAAGQAVATAHVPTHCIGAAIYALQAVYRATNSSDADAAVAKERDWQYQHLLRLRKKMASE